MMRAAIIVNPATADAPTHRAGGQDAGRRRERFRGRTVLVEADRMVHPAGGRRGHRDGRSLNAQIETGALVVRVPQPVATAA